VTDPYFSGIGIAIAIGIGRLWSTFAYIAHSLLAIFGFPCALAHRTRVWCAIYVRGSFAKPVVKVDRVRVATRALGAVALGTVNPLLTLIPLIDPGPGGDSDCRQLIHEARALPHSGHKNSGSKN
jgi:hypothetical protein